MPDYFGIVVSAARQQADAIRTLEVVRTLTAQQPAETLDRGVVDVVAKLLDGVTHRDLDSIADDIVCLVLQWDDLVNLVRERLMVQQAYRESAYLAPAADPRTAAETIITAVHAVVRPRLLKEREL